MLLTVALFGIGGFGSVTFQGSAFGISCVEVGKPSGSMNKSVKLSLQEIIITSVDPSVVVKYGYDYDSWINSLDFDGDPDEETITKHHQFGHKP